MNKKTEEFRKELRKRMESFGGSPSDPIHNIAFDMTKTGEFSTVKEKDFQLMVVEILLEEALEMVRVCMKEQL